MIRTYLETLIFRLIRGTALPTAAQLTEAVAAPTDNPWLGALAAATPIIGNVGGGANAVRVRCVLRDGRGQARTTGVLKVYVTDRITNLSASTIAANSGTLMYVFNGQADGGVDNDGGVIAVQADAATNPGRVDVQLGAFTAGAGTYRVTLEYLGHVVSNTIAVN